MSQDEIDVSYWADQFHKNLDKIIPNHSLYKDLSELEWFFRTLGDVSFMGSQWNRQLANYISSIDIVDELLEENAQDADASSIAVGLGKLFKEQWDELIDGKYEIEMEELNARIEMEELNFKLRFNTNQKFFGQNLSFISCKGVGALGCLCYEGALLLLLLDSLLLVAIISIRPCI